MGTPRIDSFEDFWPHYVGAHRKPENRLVHYLGTSCALGCVTLASSCVSQGQFDAKVAELEDTRTRLAAAENDAFRIRIIDDA